MATAAAGHDDDDGRGETIKVFLRLKPSKRPSPCIKVAAGGTSEQHDGDAAAVLPQRLAFDLPAPDAASVGGLINNNKTHHQFAFDGIFDMEATQDQVFATVGKEAVASALRGYNATIFAYGQTGSGKTFTITGGPARYADRGIIPRALAMVFNEMKRIGDVQYQVYVSYLEVYNEIGYDLLDDSYEAAATAAMAMTAGDTRHQQPLPRVTLLEDEEGNCHLRNLSMHLVGSEEEALNLLFLGDTNRAIAATAMNKASSRSHCIFTLSLEGRRRGGGGGCSNDRVLRSKLNLVDLAGSERVHKTAAHGQTLREARYINQSLFYLEMVILALHERRQHVPYRNSMMTSVLRDSLGGNCKTVMVATVSTERAHTDESISTCRFAQRVGQIRNDARCNEEVDLYQVIQRLKTELSAARAQVGYLKGEAQDERPLTAADKAAIVAACQAYVARGATGGRDGEQEGKDDDEDDAPELGSLTLARICYAFRVLRGMVLSSTPAGSTEAAPGIRGSRRASTPATLSASSPSPPPPPLPSAGRPSCKLVPASLAAGSVTPAVPLPADPAAFLRDEAAALEYFRSQHLGAAALEADAQLLKGRYKEAKGLGERVAQARASVGCLLQMVEQLRRWREDGEADGYGGDNGEKAALVDEEEAKLLQELEARKASYQEAYQRLRGLKSEIEGMQRLLEKGRLQLQTEFDSWYAGMLAQSAHPSQRPAPPPARAIVSDKSDEDPQPRQRSSLPHEVKNRSGSLSMSTSLSASSDRSRQRQYEDDKGDGGGGGGEDGGGRARGDVEDDIAAFYRAKEELLAMRRRRAAAATAAGSGGGGGESMEGARGW